MTELFWFSRSHLITDEIMNFGDELSKHLVEKISGEKVKWIDPRKQNFFQRIFGTHVLGIGSILHFGAKNSLIWGAGLIEKKSDAPNAKYFAVRGKYTREELINRGFSVPDVYGDPGLLTPKYFPSSNNNPLNRIGIIPHYVEFDEVNNWFILNKISKEIALIDLRKDVNQVIKEINNCSMILSSSLHGIIIPHAYGIPTLRISFSNKIYGDGIKYLDYFSSVGISEYNQLVIDNNMSENSIISYFNKNKKYALIAKNLYKIQEKLIEIKPF